MLPSRTLILGLLVRDLPLHNYHLCYPYKKRDRQELADQKHQIDDL